MKTLFILLSFLTSFFVRSLRWLGIVQEKEYRLDRLMLFLKTEQGKSELFRLIPQKTDFTRTGLKRPKITARILIVAVLSFLILLGLVAVLVLNIVDLSNLEIFIYLIVGFIIYLFFVPLIIFIAAIPTAMISNSRIFLELVMAKMKVDRVKPKIIGITGSYGKTSTKILLAHVLEKKFKVFKTPKSFNTRFSVAKSINKDFKDQEIMVIEYAAYKKGEIKYLAKWFQPHMAVITGLTKQHLGLFGSLEAVVTAKSELVKALGPGSKVICNGNDKGALKICEAGSSNQLEIIEAGSKNPKILKAHLNKVGKLVFVWNGFQVDTNLIGIHYLEIVQMAILTAKEFGVSDEDIADAISNFVPDEKFVYSYETKMGNLVIDDGGTSNPKGFEAAINLSSSIETPEKVLITSGIVDLGSDSDEVHLELAVKSKEVFDKVLYTGEVGNQQFLKIFGNDFIGDRAEIIDFLTRMNGKEMILLEGRIPGWVKQHLV